MKKRNTKIYFICIFTVVFNSFGQADALKKENFHNSTNYIVSLDFIDRFCDEKRQIILNGINYCERLIEVRKIIAKEDFYNYYDYFTEKGGRSNSKNLEFDCIFDHEGKPVFVGAFFSDDIQEIRNSVFFIDDVIIFFYDAMIINFDSYTPERKNKKNSLENFDMRTYFYHSLVMDKKGNYEIYSGPQLYLQDMQYDHLKKEFDWLIKFLSEELPIKIEY